MLRGIFDLWPLILVVIGIGMIFKKELLNVVLWILFLVILVAYSFFIKDNIFEKDYNNTFEEEIYSTEMRKEIEKGKLHLDVGATSFKIDSIEDDLIKIEHDGAFKYKFNNKDSIENVHISNKGNTFINGKSRNFELGINREIPWEFKMNMGAVSGELNLKDIIVNQINLDMGAGNLDMTLGNKNNFTSIDIDAGASKIIINVPKDVGLKIDLDGALNSTNLDKIGLIEESKGIYISDNYDRASSKYEIEVDMGVGNFDINYY